jgi:DNA polymerase III alpha subunit
MLSFDTAYYKVYHPQAFYAAMMQHDSKNALSFVLEAIAEGYSIKAVDINASTDMYEVDGKDIVMPLSAVKGVGQVAVASIINEREVNGPFVSCEDFRGRIPKRKANKRVVKAIFALGGFDEFGDIENLGLTSEEITDIRSDKKRNLTKKYLGFSLPTKKLMKAVRNNQGNGMIYGIVTHTYEGRSSAGRKYFKVVCWPDFKTFFFKKTYAVGEGDVVKISYKPHTQSGKDLEVVG